MDGCISLFQKHCSFSWLVFQNLCTSVLDMQTPLALNQLSKLLLSPISMVVTDSQPPLFGMLESPKIMSFPFLTWNMILKFPFLEGNIYGTPSCTVQSCEIHNGAIMPSRSKRSINFASYLFIYFFFLVSFQIIMVLSITSLDKCFFLRKKKSLQRKERSFSK